MHETGNNAIYNQWLKGEARNDDWKSPWRQDFERRSAEDKGKYVSAPQIQARQKRTPQPPRYCAVCPARLNHMNKYGFCQIHLTKNSRRALELAA